MKKVFILYLITFSLIFSSNIYGQEASVCERFEKGMTRPSFGKRIESSKASLIASSWAKWYDGLKFTRGNFGAWHYKETFSKPSSLPPQSFEAIPVTTKVIFDKNFDREFTRSLECVVQVGANLTPGLANTYANKCREASSALLYWPKRLTQLKKDMIAYCAKQKKGTSIPKSKPRVSYKKAQISFSDYQKQRKGKYETWGEEQRRNQRNFTQQYNQRRQNYARIAQIKTQMIDDAARRISSLISRIADQRAREKEAKKLRKTRKEVSYEYNRGERIFKNFANRYKPYEKKLTQWLITYGPLLDSKTKNKVQQSLKEIRSSINKSYLKIDEIYKDSRKIPLEDRSKYGVKSYINDMWSDFRSSYKVRGVTGAMYDLKEIVRKNNTLQNKIMVADYAKMGYDFELYVEKDEPSASTYAKIILGYFNDYPGSSSMKSLVDRVAKKREIERKRSLVRKSLVRLPSLANAGDNIGLNSYIDSLLQFGDKKELYDAFFKSTKAKSGMRYPRELEALIKHGFYDEYLKLTTSFVQSFHKKVKYYMAESFFATPNKSRWSNKGISFSSYVRYYEGLHMKQEDKYYRIILPHLMSPSESGFKAVNKMFRAQEKYAKSNAWVDAPYYRLWPQVSILLASENYKPLTKKKNKVSYLGLWTKAINKYKMLEVIRVDKNSPAYFNGIEVGDKILRIVDSNVKGYSFKGKPYNSYNEVLDILKKSDGKVYSYRIPIRITKENVKKQFKGQKILIGSIEEYPYLSKDKDYLDIDDYKHKIKDRGWSTYSSATMIRVIDNNAGTLTQKNLSNSTTQVQWGSKKTFSKKRMDRGRGIETNLSIKPLSGDKAWAGIYFGKATYQNKYSYKEPRLYFRINNKGQFSIYLKKNKESNKIETKWASSNAIETGSNKLSILKLKNKVQCFINDVLVYELLDINFNIDLYGYVQSSQSEIVLQDFAYYSAKNTYINNVFQDASNLPVTYDNVIISENFSSKKAANIKYVESSKITYKGGSELYFGNSYWSNGDLVLSSTYPKKTNGYLSGRNLKGNNFNIEFDFKLDNKTKNQFFRIQLSSTNYYSTRLVISPYNTWVYELKKYAKLMNLAKDNKSLPTSKNKYHHVQIIAKAGTLQFFIDEKLAGSVPNFKPLSTNWSISTLKVPVVYISKIEVSSGY